MFGLLSSVAPMLGPIGGAIGLGLQIGGLIKSTSAAKDSAKASQAITAAEQQQESLRMKAMELDARRKQMEVVRNQQRARALALTNATAQGAGAGSGLQGGYGQISGDTNTSLMGIQNALSFGRANFGLNAQISQQKILQSQAQANQAMGSGLMSLGGSLIGGMGMINSIGTSIPGMLNAGYYGGSPETNPNIRPGRHWGY